MTMEQLHFMVESPANFVRLACTILFEKREAMAEWVATWHDVFDCANGEQLFLQFMEELFHWGKGAESDNRPGSPLLANRNPLP